MRIPHPPVQGVQIAMQVHCISRFARADNMSKAERLAEMQRSFAIASLQLAQYYEHYRKYVEAQP